MTNMSSKQIKVQWFHIPQSALQIQLEIQRVGVGVGLVDIWNFRPRYFFKFYSVTGRYNRQSCVEMGVWQTLIIIWCPKTLKIIRILVFDGYRKEVIVALSSRLPCRFNGILVDSLCRRSRKPIGDNIKQNVYIPRYKMSLERRCSQMRNRGHKCNYSNKSRVDKPIEGNRRLWKRLHEREWAPAGYDKLNIAASNVTF